MSSVPASSLSDDDAIGQRDMRTARRRRLKRVASSSGDSDNGNDEEVVDGLVSEIDGDNALNADEAEDDDNKNENGGNEGGDSEDDMDGEDSNNVDNNEDDDEEEEEDLPSDREIDRIERMAERMRRKDPVRRRYILEDAGEGGDEDDDDEDCNEEEEEEEDNSEDEDEDADNDEEDDDDDDDIEEDLDGIDISRMGIEEGAGDAKVKKKSRRTREDLSHAALFANAREVDMLMDSRYGHSSNDDDDDDGDDDDDQLGRGVGEHDDDEALSDNSVVDCEKMEQYDDDDDDHLGGGVGEHDDDEALSDNSVVDCEMMEQYDDNHQEDEAVEEGRDLDNDHELEFIDFGENTLNRQTGRIGTNGSSHSDHSDEYDSGGDDDYWARLKARDEDAIREKQRRQQLLDDPDCNHNVSRTLRKVGIWDVQIQPGYDGYVYCFTSSVEGPSLSQMALKQILVLLHVVHSFIPEECIIETEFLKPTFDKQGGLEKLRKKVPMTEEDARQAEIIRRNISSVPVSDMPFDTAFVLGGSGSAEDGVGEFDSMLESVQNSLMLKQQFSMSIVDVGEIVVAPVCISYVTPRNDHASRAGVGNSSSGATTGDEDEDEEEEEKVAAFWLVMLKTRKCYSLSAHLNWLIANVDKEVGLFPSKMIYHTHTHTHTHAPMVDYDDGDGMRVCVCVCVCAGQVQHEEECHEGVRGRHEHAPRDCHVPI
jgi:hypothetical protein